MSLDYTVTVRRAHRGTDPVEVEVITGIASLARGREVLASQWTDEQARFAGLPQASSANIAVTRPDLDHCTVALVHPLKGVLCYTRLTVEPLTVASS